MNLTALHREILLDAFDDWYGLWQVIWRLRVVRPDLTDKEGLEFARNLVMDFWNGRLVRFAVFIDDMEQYTLDSEDVETILTDPLSWQPPPGRNVRFAATELPETL